MNADNGRDKRSCEELSWHVAVASNFITAIVILILSIFGEFIRKNIPGVALLSSISGIGFAYLALNEYLSIAATPIVSFVPFTIIMLGYFGQSKSIGKFIRIDLSFAIYQLNLVEYQLL